VLWVGLQKGKAEVHVLWETLSRLLAPLEETGGPLQGLPREDRDFTPHITVARAGSALIRPGWAEGVEMPGADFEITECILYQSLLGSGGARYVPLKRVSLEKGAS
jgi:2'-5' RNA ligase